MSIDEAAAHIRLPQATPPAAEPRQGQAFGTGTRWNMRCDAGQAMAADIQKVFMLYYRQLEIAHTAQQNKNEYDTTEYL